MAAELKREVGLFKSLEGYGIRDLLGLGWKMLYHWLLEVIGSLLGSVSSMNTLVEWPGFLLVWAAWWLVGVVVASIVSGDEHVTTWVMPGVKSSSAISLWIDVILGRGWVVAGV